MAKFDLFYYHSGDACKTNYDVAVTAGVKKASAVAVLVLHDERKLQEDLSGSSGEKLVC